MLFKLKCIKPVLVIYCCCKEWKTKKLIAVSAVICWAKLACGWRWLYICKGYNLFSLFLSVYVFCYPTKVHRHAKCSQSFIACGHEYSCVYFKYSILEYLHINHDLNHLILYFSQPIKCKHTLTHTATGHFIFNEVKGHSIWQHSIAYSCEMNHDCNKIDN